MTYQPLEKLLSRSRNSVYRLVLLASRRAKELADGQPRLVDITTTDKITTIALQEIRDGKVFVKGCGDPKPKKG